SANVLPRDGSGAAGSGRLLPFGRAFDGFRPWLHRCWGDDAGSVCAQSLDKSLLARCLCYLLWAYFGRFSTQLGTADSSLSPALDLATPGIIPTRFFRNHRWNDSRKSWRCLPNSVVRMSAYRIHTSLPVDDIILSDSDKSLSVC